MEDFDSTAVDIVKEFIDRQMSLESESPIDWGIHDVEITGAQGDETVTKFTIQTTVLTGYLYLVTHHVNTGEWKIFPFRDKRGIVDHDPVNHPSHYTSHPSGVECIDVTRHMSFNLGNVVKYCWRDGLKEDVPPIQDLEKAAWYLNDEIQRRKKEAAVQMRHETAKAIEQEVTAIKRTQHSERGA